MRSAPPYARAARAVCGRIVLCATASVAGAAGALAQPAQSRDSVIRVEVRVRDERLQPLVGASVTLRSGSRDARATTGGDGSASFSVPRRPALVIAVLAEGFLPTGRSVPTYDADSATIVVFTLRTHALAPLRVVARDSSLAGLGPRQSPGDGAREEYVGGALDLPHPGGDDGSIAPLVYALPGFDRTSDGRGISVLGLPAEQTQLFLNGLPLNATQLPRDLVVVGRASMSPADALAGGFAGGAVDLGVIGASNFTRLVLRGGGSMPGLGWAATGGGRSTRVQASAMRSAPVVLDRAYLVASLQVTTDARPTAWYSNAPSDVISTAGLPVRVRDSLVSRLGATGGLSTAPTEARRSEAAGLAQLEVESVLGGSVSSALLVNHERASGLGASVFSSPMRATQATRDAATVQARWRRETTDRGAWQAALVGSLERSDNASDLSLPSATVSVGGTTGVDSASRSLLALGGPARAFDRRSRDGWLLRLQRELASERSRLRTTLGIDWQSERLAAAPASRGPLHRLGYQSVDSLLRGRPVTLEQVTRVGGASATLDRLAGAWSGRVRLDGRRSLTYGLRIDHQRLQGDRAPDSLARTLVPDATTSFVVTDVSPRLGISWDYGPRDNPFRGHLGASLGRFVGSLPAAEGLVALDGGAVATRCAGPDVPVVPWPATTGTLSCGTQGTGSTTVVQPWAARQLRAPSSWRASLSWREALFDALIWPQLDVTLSSTSGLPSVDDANLLATGHATLGNEPGRLLFAPLGSIDSASAAFPLNAGRPLASAGRVGVLASRGESRAVQAVASVILPRVRGWQARLSYQWTNAEDRVIGIEDGRTAGAQPGLWAPSATASRHVARAALTGSLWGGLGVRIFSEWASGLPFTPTVDRDVNGDGMPNDAAFIPSLAAAGLPLHARALFERLPALRDEVRQCLVSQAGTIVRPRSCAGVDRWNLDMHIEAPGGLLLLPSRASLRIDVLNVPALLDRLVHGPDGLRGWGQGAPLDAVLWRATGFSPSTRSFTYALNEGFGTLRPLPTREPYLPFAVRVEVRVDLTTSLVQQTVRLAREASDAEGKARIVDSWRRRWPDPFEIIEDARDSADAGPIDMDALRDARRDFAREVNEAWRTARRLFEQRDVDDAAVAVALRTARDRHHAAYDLATAAIRAHLGPARLALLSPWVQFFLEDGASRRVVPARD